MWGRRVCWLSPGSVTGVCEREVADAQMVHGAQGPKTAVEGVAPLHPNETGCLVHAEGLQDVCGASVGGGSKTLRQAERMQKNKATFTAGGEHEDFWVFLTHPVDHVDLLQRLPDSVFVLGFAGNVS